MLKEIAVTVSDVNALKSLLGTWNTEQLLAVAKELLDTFIAANYTGYFG